MPRDESGSAGGQKPLGKSATGRPASATGRPSSGSGRPSSGSGRPPASGRPASGSGRPSAPDASREDRSSRARRAAGPAPKLTEEQKAEIASRYDPRREKRRQ